MSAPQDTPKPQHFPATRQYDSDDFERFRPWDNDPATKDNANTQHNIMMLVGNGFDIAVLSELNANYLTDYRSFFNHLQMKNFNRDNSLFKRMDELRRKDEAAETLGEEGYPNWSDFEYLLQEHVDDLSTHGGTFYTAQIKHDLEELQHEFSEFLEMVVSPSILKSSIPKPATRNGHIALLPTSRQICRRMITAPSISRTEQNTTMCLHLMSSISTSPRCWKTTFPLISINLIHTSTKMLIRTSSSEGIRAITRLGITGKVSEMPKQVAQHI